MTWERASASGLRRMGFMSTEGSTPAASACTTCARPISPPSAVTKEFRAMFWDLKCATRRPSCLRMRQRAATSTLLPTEEAVPCTIRVLALVAIALPKVMSIVQEGKHRALRVYVYNGNAGVVHPDPEVAAQVEP